MSCTDADARLMMDRMMSLGSVGLERRMEGAEKRVTCGARFSTNPFLAKVELANDDDAAPTHRLQHHVFTLENDIYRNNVRWLAFLILTQECGGRLKRCLYTCCIRKGVAHIGPE
jgi:hypothetical protein